MQRREHVDTACPQPRRNLVHDVFDGARGLERVRTVLSGDREQHSRATLDHRVAEFAARIPLDLKIRNGRGKHLVRELLYGMVPRELIDRGKAGFAPPVGDWIKGPLRPWAEDLLPTSGEFFDTEVVRRRWRDHLSGERDYSEALWGILTFQAWLRSQSNVSANAA